MYTYVDDATLANLHFGVHVNNLRAAKLFIA